MLTMLGSLVAGRIASMGEILSRASAVVAPDPVALAEHGDQWEREHEVDPLDPIHLFAQAGIVVVDLRDVPDADRPTRGRSVGVRRLAQVEGICWHQVGIAALGPDHPRLLGIPAHCHIGQRRDGTVVVTLLHRVTAYVYHGHGFNRSTIGVEVQANAAGIEGDPSTFWRSQRQKAEGLLYEDLRLEASDAVLAAISVVLRYYSQMMAARGCPLRCLNYTHRQSARKPSDPGSRIARHVAEESRRMGWKEDRSQVVLGKGKPQPDEWTGLPNGTRYR